MNSFNPYDTSQQPLLPQANQNEAKWWTRWLVLILSCISTGGVYYTDTLISSQEFTFIGLFNVSIIAYSDAMEKILGFACIVPLIAGLMIYRFGANRAYRFFILLLAIGRSFTFSSFRTQTWTLFVTGESFFYAANYGLWVAQMFMIIKWFKGKELSFAIGFIGFSNWSGYLVALFLKSYVNQIGLSNLLLLGLVLCVGAAIAVIILIKIDVAIKREEDEVEHERSFFEDLGLIKKSIVVISLAILCFSLADYASKYFYMLDMDFRFKSLTNFTLRVLNWFNQLIPLLMLPLFGLLADWKKKRIGAMFIAIIMFFIGNTAFFLFHQSTYLIFIYLAFLLFRFGFPMFQVSSFACLGIVTPRRVLGLILGLIYSLMNLGNWLEGYIFSKQTEFDVTLICYIATFALIFGIGLVVYTWKLDREEGGKIESREIENEISTDQIRINA